MVSRYVPSTEDFVSMWSWFLFLSPVQADSPVKLVAIPCAPVEVRESGDERQRRCIEGRKELVSQVD